jgi:hypothetical protein
MNLKTAVETTDITDDTDSERPLVFATLTCEVKRKSGLIPPYLPQSV